MIPRRVHVVSDRKFIAEDTQTGQFFVGDLDDYAPQSNLDLRANTFSLLLAAGFVFGVFLTILVGMLLGVLLDGVVWRTF